MKLKRVSFIVLFAALFLGVFASYAQNTPILINLDENQAGELSEAQPSVSYVVGVTQPQLITIQVLGLTTGFVPTFSIADPAGLNIFSANNSSVSIVSTTQAFINPGAYRIVVSSGNGQFGQYVISLQGGGALQPPQPISAGQVIDGSVSAEAQLLMYSFSASQRDVLRLTVRSELSNAGPSVLLQDATTGETLGLSNGRLIGTEFRIPASLVAVNYRVQVTYNPNGGAEQRYVLCLESETAPATCPGGGTTNVAVVTPPSIPSATPRPATLVPLSNTGACVIAPSGNQNVNVRSQPNTNASVLGQLPSNTTLPVTGKLGDSSWYQVSYNGVQGWVSASVVRLGGQCGAVPVVNPNTGSAPTQPSNPSQPTRTNTPVPSGGTLNFSASPNYGSTSLTSGFVPDPFSINMTSGGPVNVSYLGTGCSGFATAAPDYSIFYTAGSFPVLRFYFIGSGDTTMIINDPTASFRCIDDSFSTLNPTLDYNNPATGRYDIWIGSFSQGTNVSGTLYVTENTANHP